MLYKQITMLVSFLNLGDWSFGVILMSILVLNIAVFLVLTFLPKVHNSITCAVRRFIDLITPLHKTKV